MVIGIPELSLNNNVWIFQGNPKYYDFFSEFHDESITEGWWTVTNNKEQIIKGDIGLIWISGSDAGIYAIIEILNKPEYREDSEKLKNIGIYHRMRQIRSGGFSINTYKIKKTDIENRNHFNRFIKGSNNN